MGEEPGRERLKKHTGHRQGTDTAAIMKFEETEAWKYSDDSETETQVVMDPTMRRKTPNRVR